MICFFQKDNGFLQFMDWAFGLYIPSAYLTTYMCVSCSIASDSLQSCGLVAYQATLSIEFSRQECWSSLPFPSSGDFPDPGIERSSPAFQADPILSEPPVKRLK